MGFYPTEEGRTYANDAIFDSIQCWRAENAVLTCGAAADCRRHGLRGGHAYSVFSAIISKDGTRLVRLRNPWGESARDSSPEALAAVGLWNGAFRAGAPEWRNPAHESLRKSAIEAGATVEQLDGGHDLSCKGFCWVPWADFVAFFDTITVCHLSHDISDIRLDLHEDKGFCGPTRGCVKGCTRYYCCCEGVERLCCGADHSHAQDELIGEP
eukprot:SAG31_NODE_11445_length_1029_cov_1.225806_2_plen_212_part_00